MSRDEIIRTLEASGSKVPLESHTRFAVVQVLWPMDNGKLARMDEHGIFRRKDGSRSILTPTDGWKIVRKQMQDLLRDQDLE